MPDSISGLVPSEMNPPLAAKLVTDRVGLEECAAWLNSVQEFGLDVETNVVDDVFTRKVRTIQVGNRQTQFVVDLLAFAGSKETIWATQDWYGKNMGDTYRDLQETVFPHLLDGSKVKVGHNLSFEAEILGWCFGLRIWNVWDTMLAEKVYYAGKVAFQIRGFWALDDLVARYMRLRLDKSLQKSFGEFDGPLTPEQIDYAALDTRLPIAVRAAQLQKLQKEGLVRAAQIEMDALPAFADLHLNGMLIDKDKWRTLIAMNEEELKKNIAKLDEFFIPVVGRKIKSAADVDALMTKWKEQPSVSPEEREIKARIKAAKGDSSDVIDLLKAELVAAVEARKDRRADARQEYLDANRHAKAHDKLFFECQGEAYINYESPEQLLYALYKVKGIHTKNLVDTNDKTLEKLAGKFPVIAALRDYRETAKKLKNYGEQWIETGEYTDPRTGKKKKGHINAVTGRIHSRFEQLGAETGRTASRNPNLTNVPSEADYRTAFIARPGRKIITADMSGAELRILADGAKAKTWLDAFNSGQDVHAVSTEILYPKEWPEHTKEGCEYFALGLDGKPKHEKCSCPEHKKLRDKTKSTNFLLAYGGGAFTLAQRVGCSVTEAEELLSLHRSKFPDVWAYLDKSGRSAKFNLEARTFSGRRRLFKKPEYAEAAKKAQEKLKRLPTPNEITKQLVAMFAGIEREGKNHPAQGGNADLLKIEIGAGADKSGKKFLWHILPQYDALLINEVHDEVVCEVPEANAEACKAAIDDAIRRAGAEFLTGVAMESESRISHCWRK